MKEPETVIGEGGLFRRAYHNYISCIPWIGLPFFLHDSELCWGWTATDFPENS